MTRNPALRRLLASTLLVPAILLGACGGDDEAASDDAPAATEAASGGDAVKIVDFNYDPDDLKVAAGTKVTFTNEDDFAHTVTAKDKSYDSGNIDKSGTFEHTYAEPGTYEYFCAIHNSMTGKVVVE